MHISKLMNLRALYTSTLWILTNNTFACYETHIILLHVNDISDKFLKLNLCKNIPLLLL